MNLFDVYPLFDIEITKGRGCHVYDADGTEYLDLYGGHAVVSVGHCHPVVVKAIEKQASQLMFYSNSVINPFQQQLAEKLGKISGYDDYSLFLVNSGAEANENALKLASFHTGRKRVVAFRRAFHGRTSAAVEVTDNPKIVSPLNSNNNVTFLPLNDIDAMCDELAKGDVAAVIIEGIQGVGGIRIPEADFLRVLREECNRYGTVLILDEIQSGYGRSGRFFAHQNSGIRPDIITCAKGIATGFPMGAVLISPMFKPSYGMLGTTFGGNHLACATAIAVLDIIEEEHLVENAAKVGQYLIDRLKDMPEIKEVRGLGLMIGIEMPFEVKELRRHLINVEHVFTGAASTDIVRLLPPLTLTIAQADDFLERFRRALTAL
ncbi:aminotransferase class III-fold pyridoxal phosphate-dependent enzyme [Muribaculaceae bacterium Isolate-042 (Harlan)]|uniref:aspartate aminotransferase family protein n=1 Tax=Muribaculum intestinale TaxID=1796646 RepID=UPI000F49A04B|nr:aminotransferase class III-fold pyridoxal phosphate-dependent enzyme [Muribaculum intestinale]MCX4368677.1 aminotransferase class III-fold pyridoxal phosphate-dependent enzyme [Duncaniella sp.]ROS81701.1 aminotransferase class III-fold pyridoxal phosphate-dependent enzyme [Muribaculaceae bacterium Isolate-042 (Harlan)]